MLKEKLTIRDCKPEDKEAIIAITKAAWGGVAFSKIVEDRYGVRGGKPWWQHKVKSILKNMESNPDRFFVAEYEGKVVGYALYSSDPDSKIGRVRDNAVSPDFGGKGIGAAMHRAVLRALKESGMELAQVTTGLAEGFAPARKMYERQGFKEVQRHVDYVLPLAGLEL